MATLQIKSNNPNFSFILKKNPESPVQVKNMRHGFCFGWYSNTETYNIFFKDAPNEVSYKTHPDEDFEYINVSRYNSAMFAVNSFSNFFQYNLKSQDELDVEDRYNHTIILSMLSVESAHYLKIFNEHFEDFNILFEEIAHKNYKIEINSKKSIHKLLNFTSLFVIFNALRNNDYMMVDESVIDKYLASLDIVDSPYFIRYIFKINFLINRNKFEKYKDLIERSNTHKIKFEMGNTLEMRKRFIKNSFDFNLPIVDLGCGEGNYVIDLSRELKDKKYFAVDRDSNCLEIVKNKINRKKIENVEIFSSYEEFTNFTDETKYDVLLTEVIEHSPVEEATELVAQILNNESVRKIVITTPNRDFNNFYMFKEGQFRHDDHNFEFNFSEFQVWLLDILKINSSKFKVEFAGFGDTVNDIPVTIAATVERM